MWATRPPGQRARVGSPRAVRMAESCQRPQSPSFTTMHMFALALDARQHRVARAWHTQMAGTADAVWLGEHEMWESC
jgi:hypothetical protein